MCKENFAKPVIFLLKYFNKKKKKREIIIAITLDYTDRYYLTVPQVFRLFLDTNLYGENVTLTLLAEVPYLRAGRMPMGLPTDSEVDM